MWQLTPRGVGVGGGGGGTAGGVTRNLANLNDKLKFKKKRRSIELKKHRVT